MPARVSAWAIYRVFKTIEGEQVFVGVTSDKHWHSFCTAFERPDLLADETLATNNGRIAQRERLLPELETFFAQLPKAEILRRCEQAAIPFAPIAHPEDLFTDEHLAASGALFATRLPTGETAPLPRQPFSLETATLDLYVQPPQVGEHTAEILSALGYNPAEQNSLIASQTVSVPNP
jgi:crotonobetainyl-CoA:carnitine CoA-transferase CaiB-like acyl-CoA transferase